MSDGSAMRSARVDWGARNTYLLELNKDCGVASAASVIDAQSHHSFKRQFIIFVRYNGQDGRRRGESERVNNAKKKRKVRGSKRKR